MSHAPEETKSITAEEVAMQLRFQFQHAIHADDIDEASECLRKLKAIKQPLRDPDLQHHARQMSTLTERALYRAFGEAEVGETRSFLHDAYQTVRHLWFRR